MLCLARSGVNLFLLVLVVSGVPSPPLVHDQPWDRGSPVTNRHWIVLGHHIVTGPSGSNLETCGVHAGARARHRWDREKGFKAWARDLADPKVQVLQDRSFHILESWITSRGPHRHWNVERVLANKSLNQIGRSWKRGLHDRSLFLEAGHGKRWEGGGDSRSEISRPVIGPLGTCGTAGEDEFASVPTD